MLQILANSLLTASIYALVGVGFGLGYQATGFLNFAHAAPITAVAYGLYVSVGILGIPWYLSLLLALASGIVLCLAIQIVVFWPLRRANSSPLTRDTPNDDGAAAFDSHGLDVEAANGLAQIGFELPEQIVHHFGCTPALWMTK